MAAMQSQPDCKVATYWSRDLQSASALPSYPPAAKTQPQLGDAMPPRLKPSRSLAMLCPAAKTQPQLGNAMPRG